MRIKILYLWLKIIAISCVHDLCVVNNNHNGHFIHLIGVDMTFHKKRLHTVPNQSRGNSLCACCEINNVFGISLTFGTDEF